MFWVIIFVPVVKNMQCVCWDVIVCFMYLTCSRYLISIGYQSDQRMICCIFCIVICKFRQRSFCFVVICCIFDCICCCQIEVLCLNWYFLNRLVTLFISGLWYVNVIYFIFCVCMGVFFVSCVLIILFLKFCIIRNGKPLFLAIIQMVFHSRCLVCSVIGVDNMLFM